MTVSDVAVRMTQYPGSTLHDSNHLMKVYAYAATIGRQEGLDAQTQEILEIAALMHDIACPLCREKYGNTNGKLQEREGQVLAEAFLRDAGFPPAVVSRVIYLIGHHHTTTDVDGLDHRILLEADFLVNAEESHLSPEAIAHGKQVLFRTAAGLALLKALYAV